MATDSVHEIYQRVVAKRPEAAVPNMTKQQWGYELPYEHPKNIPGSSAKAYQLMCPQAFESLIVAHWLSEAICIQSAGHYVCFQKRADGTHRLCRFEPNSETWEQLGTGATPLHALAAYLEGNT